MLEGPLSLELTDARRPTLARVVPYDNDRSGTTADSKIVCIFVVYVQGQGDWQNEARNEKRLDTTYSNLGMLILF